MRSAPRRPAPQQQQGISPRSVPPQQQRQQPLARVMDRYTQALPAYKQLNQLSQSVSRRAPTQAEAQQMQALSQQIQQDPQRLKMQEQMQLYDQYQQQKRPQQQPQLQQQQLQQPQLQQQIADRSKNPTSLLNFGAQLPKNIVGGGPSQEQSTVARDQAIMKKHLQRQEAKRTPATLPPQGRPIGTTVSGEEAKTLGLGMAKGGAVTKKKAVVKKAVPTKKAAVKKAVPTKKAAIKKTAIKKKK